MGSGNFNYLLESIVFPQRVSLFPSGTPTKGKCNEKEHKSGGNLKRKFILIAPVLFPKAKDKCSPKSYIIFIEVNVESRSNFSGFVKVFERFPPATDDTSCSFKISIHSVLFRS